MTKLLCVLFVVLCGGPARADSVEIHVLGPGRFWLHDRLRGPARIDATASIEQLDHGTWRAVATHRLFAHPTACIELDSLGSYGFRPPTWLGSAGTYRLVVQSCDHADTSTSREFTVGDADAPPWTRADYTVGLTAFSESGTGALELLQDSAGFRAISPEAAACTPDVAFVAKLSRLTRVDAYDVTVSYDKGCGIVTVASGLDVLTAAVTDRRRWERLATR